MEEAVRSSELREMQAAAEDCFDGGFVVSRVWLACIVGQRCTALRQAGSRVLGYRTAKASAAAGALVSRSPTQGDTRCGN
jgi:hypothetical protein